MIIQTINGAVYKVKRINRDGDYINGYNPNEYGDYEMVFHMHKSDIWKIEID